MSKRANNIKSLVLGLGLGLLLAGTLLKINPPCVNYVKCDRERIEKDRAQAKRSNDFLQITGLSVILCFGVYSIYQKTKKDGGKDNHSGEGRKTDKGVVDE